MLFSSRNKILNARRRTHTEASRRETSAKNTTCRGRRRREEPRGMSQWSLEGDSTLAGGESRLVLPCTEGAASAFDLGRGRLFAAYGKVFAHSTVSRV